MNDIVERAVKELDRLLIEQPLLNKNETNLNFAVYVSKAQGSHAARIKISRNKDGNNFNTKHDSIPIVVSHEPWVPDGIDTGDAPKGRIKDALKWVKINHQHLTDFWNDKIEMPQLKERLLDLNGNRVKCEQTSEDELHALINYRWAKDPAVFSIP